MSIRTDLALELRESINKPQLEGVELIESIEEQNISITHVKILNDIGSRQIGKPVGNYITIEAPSIHDRDIIHQENLSKILCQQIKKILPHKNNFSTLIVGLGNWNVTADALGPEVVENTMVTRHVKENIPDQLDNRVQSVCAITPGVLGLTGIESAEIVKSIVNNIRPDLVIAIDSLAARSINRIGTTFQLTDTGISPGSGIGNKRIGLSQETLGIPVIAIGVPMVVYASTIAQDILINVVESTPNLNEDTVSHLIDKILPTDMEELVVTPKEIDIMIEDSAKIISDALNIALHHNIDLEFVKRFMH